VSAGPRRAVLLAGPRGRSAHGHCRGGHCRGLVQRPRFSALSGG